MKHCYVDSIFEHIKNHDDDLQIPKHFYLNEQKLLLMPIF